MSKESKKKSLTEKLSDTAAEVNRGGDFEKLSQELSGDIPKIAVDFHGKLMELEKVGAHKKNAKIRYQRELDAGNEETMSVCLKEIRERNEQAEKLRSELAGFPTVVKKLYERQGKIFTVAREGQVAAAAKVREAEKLLKSAELRVRACYTLQGSINDLNKSVEDIVRGYKQEKKASEAEIKLIRSNKDGFWLEVDDPFAEGTLRTYRKLKKVDGLDLPCLLSFADKERSPVEAASLKKKFEASEALQAEFGDVQSYIEFKSKIVVQTLENYILRTAGGDRRREFAAKVALQKCR